MEHQEEEPQEVTEEEGPLSRFLLGQPGAERVGPGVINVPKRGDSGAHRPRSMAPTGAQGLLRSALDHFNFNDDGVINAAPLPIDPASIEVETDDGQWYILTVVAMGRKHPRRTG